MKNVFYIRRNSDQVDRNGVVIRSSDAFVDRTLEDGLARKMQDLRAEGGVIARVAKKFQIITVITLILCMAGVLFLIDFLESGIENGFKETLEHAPWLLIVAASLICIGGISFLIVFFLNRQRNDSPAVRYFNERSKKLEKECFDSLGVPEDAPFVDVYAFVTKNKIQDSARRSALYQNVAKKVFREGEALCFADTSDVVKIPLARITGVVRTEKRILVNCWNKEDRPNKGRYKQYKIKSDQYGSYYVKPYYVLQIAAELEQFEIIIPCYDIETVLPLTGRNAY